MAARVAISLQALDGKHGRFLQVAAFCGHRCTTTALSSWGTSTYPLATQPSRLVRMGEEDKWLLAVKGAFQDFITSSHTSRKKGTGAERSCELRSVPRNQSSSRERSGLGGIPPARCSQLPGQAWPSALGSIQWKQQHPRWVSHAESSS